MGLPNKLQDNILFNLNEVSDKIEKLNKKVESLESQIEDNFKLQSAHLCRIKNGEVLADDYILHGRCYNDLSPERAFNFYSDPENDFILLDVSKKEFHAAGHMPEAINIPLEELGIRYKEIKSKNAPILIICENGTRSILAAEMLYKFNFYNVNIVSGGFKFWPAFKNHESENTKATA